MSKITTLSKFYFGTDVTLQNRALDFSEGGPEIQATLNIGTYSLTEFAAEIQRAMNVAGSQIYSVTVNRTTQKITIASLGTFELLRGTGSRAGNAIWTLMGFGSGGDLTGYTSYQGANIAGYSYTTQYKLSDYISDEDNLVKENSVVNDTPAGIAQAVNFGDGSRIEMNIPIITDLTNLKLPVFYNNPNGVNDARFFIKYILSKKRIEFMPDMNNPNTFFKVYLESTSQDRDGKRWVLKNITHNIYESGKLIFRKVLT